MQIQTATQQRLTNTAMEAERQTDTHTQTVDRYTQTITQTITQTYKQMGTKSSATEEEQSV